MYGGEGEKREKRGKRKKKWDEGRVAGPLYKDQVRSCWNDMLEFISQAHGKRRGLKVKVKGEGRRKQKGRCQRERKRIEEEGVENEKVKNDFRLSFVCPHFIFHF